ncbi:MAG TPA: hypothetical protein VKI44_03555 [Acetobacteraceae bacterium]|nr:hypothetical protein [Acetobacteraceae bacterium]
MSASRYTYWAELIASAARNNVPGVTVKALAIAADQLRVERRERAA